jgi:pilus assembly protein Flp/PilA
MAMKLLNIFVRLHEEEAGQGLVEYVLLIALVAFAATAGMGSLASSVNSAFSQVGTIISSYVT